MAAKTQRGNSQGSRDRFPSGAGFRFGTRWGKKKEGEWVRLTCGARRSARGRREEAHLLPGWAAACWAAGEDGPRGRFWAAPRGKRKGAGRGEGSWASAWIPGVFSLFFFYFFSVSFSKAFPNRILKAQNKICLSMNAQSSLLTYNEF